MLVPLEWLSDYIDLDVEPAEFCERMIMSGSNVESVENIGEGIEGVVVGKITKIEKHPGADKLLICTVDVGGASPALVITGAPNVFQGAVVPVALHGSKIPGPLHGQPKTDGPVEIKRGSIRGVESDGMLCSASELGFADKVIPVASRDGIWILKEEYAPGTDINDALGLPQSVVDFDITPNRPDCLSMIGMAREAGATFKKGFKYSETDCTDEVSGIEEYVTVEIKNPLLCKRYTARAAVDIKIAESPWWLQKRLMLAGMRPINNIVDITNFVMLEYGEPIHAFDIRQIEGGAIIVDTAGEGELFTTLDQTERRLTGDMLLIKDAKKAIAIAGVMGGLNSEIREDTKTIIIEAANFDGDSVRATSKKLALRTEASARFEKGIDPDLCLRAVNRVCRLIELVGAGKAVKGAVDVYPSPEKRHTVSVRVKRVNDILGTDMQASAMAEIFKSLEMDVSGGDEVLAVSPPTVRRDLLEEIDFVEEAARIYGYDRLPVSIPKSNCEAGMSRGRMLKDLAGDAMRGMGANEIQTYSFVSPKGVDNINLADDVWERDFVRIINPLGDENSVMRTVLTPNMIEAVGRNYSRNIQNVRAFEIGNTFTKSIAGKDGLPDEQDSMAIAVYGQNESFFTLKGMVVELLYCLGIKKLVFEREPSYGAYHPGRCARIFYGGTELGIMGEVHPDVCEKYGIDTRCYCCELRFDMVILHANVEKLYKPLPKYPSVLRDIALLADEDMPVSVLKEIIIESGGGLLESAELFDVYRGRQVAEGKKSVAFALSYRAPDKTLTDEEVEKVHNKVLGALFEKAKAVLRDV